MSFRADPELIGGLARDLQRSTESLSSVTTPREPDAGPSTAAISATLAELLRADAGLAEITSNTADDLEANKTTYASTEDSNEGRFSKFIGPVAVTP